MPPCMLHGFDYAIQARGLFKELGGRVVLNGIDLDVRAGECLLLRGVNGSGKTTLLRCLASSMRPTAGEVRWFGQCVGRSPLLRRLIGVVAHESRLYPQLTLRENLLFAARLYGVDRPMPETQRLLSDSGMAAHQHRLPGEVSRGMRQRVSLARAFLHRPRLLFLDEPFAALDAQGRRWLRDCLSELCRQGRTLMLVTHDEDVAGLSGVREMKLQGGRLRAVDVVAAPDSETLSMGSRAA